MRQALATLSAALCLASTACTTPAAGPDLDLPVVGEPTAQAPTLPRDTTVAYESTTGVDPDLQSVDVYFHSNVDSLRPVVVWVHGGAWSGGDKANNISAKRELFRDEQNYVFVSANYRLTDRDASPDDSTRLMFPTHNLDVARAVAWVYANISAYGGDPARVVLLGHSAGGHLVSLTGTNAEFLQPYGLTPSTLRGVAVIDTEGYDVEGKVASGNALYRLVFGTDPEQLRRASPLASVRAGGTSPPFFIAKRGSRTRLAIADEFIDALRDAGTEATELETQAYDHEGIHAAIGSPGEEIVTPALVAWLEDVLAD